VQNGQTLKGFGIVSGPMTIASGGTLHPAGTATGTLTTGELTISDGGILDYLFGAGFASSWVSVGGAPGAPLHLPTGAGSITLHTNSLTGLAEGSYKMFTYSAITGGNPADFNATFTGYTAPSGKSISFNKGANEMDLVISTGPATVIDEWKTPGSGLDWGTPTNWVGGNVPGGLPGDTAKFLNRINAATSVYLNGDRKIGVLNMSAGTPATVNYTIAQGSSGSLIFATTGDDATVSVTSGKPTISAPVQLNNSVAITTTDAASTLTISGQITQNGLGKSLTKIGSGALVLSSATANVYSGGTFVEGGTLAIANRNALPVGGNVKLSGNGSVLVLDSTWRPAVAAGDTPPLGGGAAANLSAGPEPGTLALLAAACLLAAIAWWRRRLR
jgi:fibronectin-binding autotransporter adhesin